MPFHCTGQASASADASALVVATFLDSTRQWLPAGHCAVHVQSLQQRWSHLYSGNVLLSWSTVGVLNLQLPSTQRAVEVFSSVECPAGWDAGEAKRRKEHKWRENCFPELVVCKHAGN